MTAVALLLAVMLGVGGVAAPPAQADPYDPMDELGDSWRKGEMGFVQLPYWYGGIVTYYTFMATQISWQGPPTRPKGTPRVGETFYLRLETGMLIDVFTSSMTYRMELLLPDGLVPALSNANPMMCGMLRFDPDTGEVGYGRNMPECALPTRVGLVWRFPAVTILEDELADFWFPVKATRPLANVAASVTATKLVGIEVPVNPLYSVVEGITVQAGPPSPPRQVSATAGTRSVTVAWAPPATTGGRAITGYTARAWSERTGGSRLATCTTTRRTCTITGLRSGRRVFVDVVARNVLGTGQPSTPRVASTPR